MIDKQATEGEKTRSAGQMLRQQLSDVSLTNRGWIRDVAMQRNEVQPLGHGQRYC
jgi:hypothetical protein